MSGVIGKDKTLAASNKVMAGRMQRMETIIERQRWEISDLRMRSMRDNVIIKTKGQEYKETTNENTAAKFQAFLGKELKLANADKIDIPRSHRMGRAQNGYNRMMIAKIPSEESKRRIFSNAKALQNTNFSISSQIPHEIEERRMFGWQEYKRARQDGVFARFDGARLFIDNTPVAKYDPVSLPLSSDALAGTASVPRICTSDEHTVGQHVIKAWAVPATTLQEVREGFDTALSSGMSSADHVPYAYRIRGPDGELKENFDSDCDLGAGLTLLKYLRDNQAQNVAVFVAHYVAKNDPITTKDKTSAMQQAVSAALNELGRHG